MPTGVVTRDGALSPVNHYTYITFMAKGSAMGLWKGKKGSSVFYKIKNSNSAQKQGIRERVYEVSNPKTASQATQRMKMLPAQRIANILKEVIERGFEGVPYGVQSRQAFLKYALKMTSGVPATDKDASNVYPGKYLIAKGQLPEIVVSDSDNPNYMNTSLAFDQTGFDIETRAGISQALLQQNAFLKEGDQITIVTCQLSDSDLSSAILYWNVNSWYIDSSAAVSEDFVSGLVAFDNIAAVNGPNIDIETPLLAAAVIISRESVTGGHLRSNAVLHINSAFETELFGAAALSRARKSYQNSSVSNSDWPVDPDAEGEVDPDRVRMARLTIDVSDTNNGTIRVSVPSMPDLVYDDIAMNSQDEDVVINLPVGVPAILTFVESTTGSSYCDFDAWVVNGGRIEDNPATITIDGATPAQLITSVVERG